MSLTVLSRFKIQIFPTSSVAIALLSALAGLFLYPIVAESQEQQAVDTVYVRVEDEDRIAKFPGTIVEYNVHTLTLQMPSRRRDFNANHVVRIETKYVANHTKAREFLAQREFENAFTEAQAALRDEQRPWVQREIVALMLECLEATSSPNESAAELFVRLVNQESETRFFYWIPLRWPGGGVLSAAQKELAGRYLRSDESVSQLIGASWLLGGAERQQAIKVLEELASDVDPRIAHLASAQLWQTKLLTVKESELERWRKQIERMPRELRPGPMLVLGLALSRSAKSPEEVDDAASLLMRIPILYRQRYLQSSEALAACGTLLSNRGRNDEARLVFIELVSQFGRSQAAKNGDVLRLLQGDDK